MLRAEPLQGIAPDQGIVDHEADALQKAAIGEAVERVQVQQEQRDQRLDVVRFPAAVDICLAQADVAARQCLAQHIPVIES